MPGVGGRRRGEKGPENRMPVGILVANCTRCKRLEPWDWDGGANAARLLGPLGVRQVTTSGTG